MIIILNETMSPGFTMKASIFHNGLSFQSDGLTRTYQRLQVCPQAKSFSRNPELSLSGGRFVLGTAGSGWGYPSWHAPRGYAFNSHLNKHVGEELVHGRWHSIYSQAVPVRLPAQTPLMGDGAMPSGFPKPEDKLPVNSATPLLLGEGSRLATWCLERHGKGINMVFVDGHVQRLHPRELWTLHWDGDGKWQEEWNQLPADQRGP